VKLSRDAKWWLDGEETEIAKETKHLGVENRARKGNRK
jgi:hypothetical protein